MFEDVILINREYELKVTRIMLTAMSALEKSVFTTSIARLEVNREPTLTLARSNVD